LNNESNEPKHDWEIDGGKPKVEVPKVVESGNEPMVDVKAGQDRLGGLQEKDEINCQMVFHELVKAEGESYPMPT
jgi:hypothetical protein